MKLIVGLGNPGNRYKNTRHNVGFMVVDEIASGVSGSKWEEAKKFHCSLFTVDRSLLLAKPQTFMNESGKAVKKLMDFYKIGAENLYVVHDDLDISLGNYKIQLGKGPELHYGVKSVETELGTKDFWRVRVGIDNRDPENRIHGEAYTLQEFTQDEQILLHATIDRILSEIQKVLA